MNHGIVTENYVQNASTKTVNFTVYMNHGIVTENYAKNASTKTVNRLKSNRYFKDKEYDKTNEYKEKLK